MASRNAVLLRSPDDETAFATMIVGDHLETWPVRSPGFRRWLTHRFYKAWGKPPSPGALSEAIGTLEAKAQFEGDDIEQVFIRVGELDGTVYLDLVNAKWEVIEITAAGWQIIEFSPVKFRRTRGMQPVHIRFLAATSTTCVH